MSFSRDPACRRRRSRRGAGAGRRRAARPSERMRVVSATNFATSISRAGGANRSRSSNGSPPECARRGRGSSSPRRCRCSPGRAGPACAAKSSESTAVPDPEEVDDLLAAVHFEVAPRLRGGEPKGMTLRCRRAPYTLVNRTTSTSRPWARGERAAIRLAGRPCSPRRGSSRGADDASSPGSVLGLSVDLSRRGEDDATDACLGGRAQHVERAEDVRRHAVVGVLTAPMTLDCAAR